MELNGAPTYELMNELEKRNKKYSENKFIVRCYCDDEILEETAKTRKEAKRILREMKERNPYAYAHYFKIPFSRRHPDFPLYVQTVTLLLLIFPSIVDWCIRHILQIAQLWK